MQRRFARMNNSMPQPGGRVPPTPSPHSTDDLLPTLEEDKQVGKTNKLFLIILIQISAVCFLRIFSNCKQYLFDVF